MISNSDRTAESSASLSTSAAPILTMKEVALVLQCSKTHVSNLLSGKVPGVSRLSCLAMGRRKVVRREWLEQWMEANRSQ